MPLKIKLVSMPFGDLYRPSLALTQLKAAALAELGERVQIDIHYLTIETARVIGRDMYGFIANDTSVYVTGFGEWLFRQAAFPDVPDNATEYITRHRRQLGSERMRILEDRVLPFKAQVPKLLDDLLEQYNLLDADVVGFATMFAQTIPSIAMARRLKERRPELITIIGGANCEGTMGIELVNHVDVLDYVFSGHSLRSFPQFLAALLAGDRAACDKLDGVFTRQNSRSIADSDFDFAKFSWGKHKPQAQLVGIKERALELDLNAPLELDYDSYIAQLQHTLPDSQQRPSIPFETSRGCWWGERAHCTFCGLNGTTMAYRAMAPERALGLIQGLLTRYVDHAGGFESADNIMPKEYFEEVFAKLETPESATLFYEVKADLTDREVEILSKARVKVIQPGIEALATSTLKIMRKGTTAFNNVRLLMSCTEHQVSPHWNLLVGFPGEAKDVFDSYMSLIPKLFHLPPPTGALPVRFDWFSPYFTMAEEYGLKPEPYDYYGMCYPFPPLAIKNMAYYFQDTNFEAQYLADIASSLTRLREVVNRWKSRWPSYGETQPVPPQLRLMKKGDRSYVVDERWGPRREIDVSPAEVAMLESAVSPEREEILREQNAVALNRLIRMGFTMQERGRVMNLVLGVKGKERELHAPASTTTGGRRPVDIPVVAVH